jgi:choline transporter-like protein 2/4/5
MTISGVIARYYFTREPRKENMPSFPVFESFVQSLKYHTGSLALGSFLITLCNIIRIILTYLQEKAKDSESKVVKFIVKCLSCYFYCLEKFLKFLNRNVYVMIAIHGENFFTSARKVFGLIARNLVRVAVLNWTGDFVLFFGKIFVSGLTTGLALLFFSKNDNITFPIIPSIIIFIMSYVVSGAFTSLFELGIDSVFLCFMEDEERNDGSPGREPYAPPEIKSVLSN